MFKKKANILGLDVGKSVIKLVEYSRVKKQVITLAKLFIEPSEWKNEKELKKKIFAWLEEKKQANKTEIVAALSGEFSVLRNIALPSDEKNIREAIKWELEQYLNDPLSHYSLDYSPSSESTKENPAYIATAFRKAEVEKMVRILDGGPHIPLTVLDIDVAATINAFEANYPEHLDKKTILLKADLNSILCIYTKNGQFLQMESLRMPEEYVAAELEERQEIINVMVPKIKILVESGFMEKGSPVVPDKVYFCGDLAADFDFSQELEKEFEIEIEKLNAFKSIDFPYDPEYADKVLETAPQCATALGLALRFAGDKS